MSRRMLGALALVASACSTRSFDVGRNEPRGPSPTSTLDAGLAPSQYGCNVTFDVAQINDLKGLTCTGACTRALGVPYAPDTQTELVAAMLGYWTFCGPAPFGPPDAIGIEFGADCSVFFLVRDSQGAPVRGTERAYQTNFRVYDLTSPEAPRRIDLLLGESDLLALDVRASACPNRVQLVSVATGAIIELASDGFGDAGRPPSIK